MRSGGSILYSVYIVTSAWIHMKIGQKYKVLISFPRYLKKGKAVSGFLQNGSLAEKSVCVGSVSAHVSVCVCLHPQQVNHRRPSSILIQQLIWLQPHPWASVAQCLPVAKLSTVLVLN